jgi:CubicO group peptidase (beta-lactamase class C family)
MSLNDKLSQYYDGFPKGDSITIEHLLTHTSGVRNFTEEDSSINTADELGTIQYLKTLKPDFAPERLALQQFRLCHIELYYPKVSE